MLFEQLEPNKAVEGGVAIACDLPGSSFYSQGNRNNFCESTFLLAFLFVAGFLLEVYGII